MTPNLLVREVHLLSKRFTKELAEQTLLELYNPDPPPHLQIVNNPSELRGITAASTTTDLHQKLYPLWHQADFSDLSTLFTFESAKPGYYFDIIKQNVLGEDAYLNGYHLPINQFLHVTEGLLQNVAGCFGFALFYQECVVACQYPQINFLDDSIDLQFQDEDIVIPYRTFSKMDRKTF